MYNGQLYLCIAEHEWSDQLAGCIWGVPWHQVGGELPACCILATLFLSSEFACTAWLLRWTCLTA